jgi:hypothetical protein
MADPSLDRAVLGLVRDGSKGYPDSPCALAGSGLPGGEIEAMMKFRKKPIVTRRRIKVLAYHPDLRVHKVMADCSGYFGITRRHRLSASGRLSVGSKYTVVHIPTGLFVETQVTRVEARRLVRAIGGLFWDFNRKEAAPPQNHDAVRRALDKIRKHDATAR